MNYMHRMNYRKLLPKNRPWRQMRRNLPMLPRMTLLPVFPLARELTFNGKAQELIDVEDIPEGALCYSLDGEAFSPEIPTGTNAGDYIVYYRAAGEETAQVSSLTVTISKADVIFTAPSAVE